MGVVYAASDPVLGRRVAIKLLRPTGRDPEAGRIRLLREAQAMAKLSHPAVVPVFDVGTHLDQVWVAMEYVAGQTLGEWLRGGPRAWREGLARMVGAGRGLAAAHAAGVVHRDFKPDNVLCGSDGRVAVTDFGLARLGDDSETLDADAPERPGAVALTVTGAVMGTPAYMSPEQFFGKPA